MDRAACFIVPRHHRNLWREYADRATEATRVADAGDTRAAGFGDGFLPELYHRLYAEQPREVADEERQMGATAVRHKLHALASELPEFDTLRKQTVRDPMWAGMAACALGERVAGAMPRRVPTPDADAAHQMLEGLLSLAAEGPEAALAFATHIERAQANVDVADEAVGAQAMGLDDTAIRNALRAGIAAAAQTIDDANAALSAFGWGSDVGGSASAKDPGVAVELARRVRSSATLQRIVELAGRLTMTARAKRASRTEYARSEVVGVEQTGDISRLLPCELVALADPLQTAALYRRMLERSALGYKVSGTEPSAKGPIVILIDQSSSMSEGGKDEWAKAVALALLDAARAERRAFGIVLYNSGVAEARMFPVAADVDPRVLLDLLSSAPYGGTSYAPAMTQALDWISMAGTFSKADVVHITDGDASTSGADLALVRAKELGVTIFGIAIGFSGPGLTAWSHEVTAIRDISSDTVAVDLIFDAI